MVWCFAFSNFISCLYCSSLIISRVSLVCRNRNFLTFIENSTFLLFLKCKFLLSDCNTGFLLFSGFFIYSLCALIFCSFYILLITSFFITIQESKLLVAKILCKTLYTGVMLSITRFINNSVFVFYLAKPKFYVCLSSGLFICISAFLGSNFSAGGISFLLNKLSGRLTSCYSSTVHTNFGIIGISVNFVEL